VHVSFKHKKRPGRRFAGGWRKRLAFVPPPTTPTTSSSSALSSSAAAASSAAGKKKDKKHDKVNLVDLLRTTKTPTPAIGLLLEDIVPDPSLLDRPIVFIDVNIVDFLSGVTGGPIPPHLERVQPPPKLAKQIAKMEENKKGKQTEQPTEAATTTPYAPVHKPLFPPRLKKSSSPTSSSSSAATAPRPSPLPTAGPTTVPSQPSLLPTPAADATSFCLRGTDYHQRIGLAQRQRTGNARRNHPDVKPLHDNISGPETRLWDANTPCISTASLPRFEAALALNLAAFDRLFGYYSAPKYVFYFILFYLFKIILFPGSVVHALLPASASNALLTASQRPSRATLSSSVTRAAPVPCPRCDTVLSLVSLYATIWHPRAR